MFEPITALIDKHAKFLISGHVNPDGDCLGTQVALYHLLRQMGKTVAIVNSHRPEARYDFLTRHTPFGVHEAGKALPEHEVHFLTDCSTLARLGSVGQAAKELTGIVRCVVDHHVGSDRGDGDVLLWDVKACACGELIYDLFREIGAPMNTAAAEGIFVSITSDTGWFRYSNTTDDALAICADLIVQGVKPHEIYNALFRRRHKDSLSLLADCMQRSSFAAQDRIAVCSLPTRYVRRASEIGFDTDELLDQLRSIDGIDVVVLLKERDDGTVKFSLRASERVDVDAIARTFGGGGHRKAAGGEVAGSLEVVREQVVGKVAEALEAITVPDVAG